jgi:hypothetical protein
MGGACQLLNPQRAAVVEIDLGKGRNHDLVVTRHVWMPRRLGWELHCRRRLAGSEPR